MYETGKPVGPITGHLPLCHVGEPSGPSVVGHQCPKFVHGIGGIIGALLTGVFVAESLGGSGLAEGMSMAGQVWVQSYAIVATIIYDVILTFIILKALDVLIGLRVNEEQETEGLDVAQHGERGYTF
ncbi:MAG: hypothetical protein DRR03_06710 [Gammaproteobacteria bacterium]|nr:MAG: hypothetical protein DRR03_06710 [Gammaproteobacteria bacterium]